MATFELILMLLIAVLLSSVLDQLVPRISSPLIQIGLGVVIAVLAISPIEVSLDPELFLVLFIAPLLFCDALEANKKSLWDNKFPILAFAIGLVLLITLCVGFALNWLVPSVPLAAAFALGAALGPTDAVAVQALKKEAQVGKRENAILQGEALLNDASGVVAFQFAIAAAVTGVFSLADATVSFAISFVGGIVLGLLLALAFLFVSQRMRSMGLDNITFHVLFEVSMPFVVFTLSEVLHVSGILAVVACGILWSMRKERKISPYQSRLNIALSSVWSAFAFALNGIVFVLLGTQLPLAMQSSWDDVYISNVDLVCYVLILTVLIVGLRFLWALFMARVSRNPETGQRDKISKSTLKNALITTVGGPKGAITLSIVFTVPFLLADGSTFPQRSLIIFLASGVILCTLLLANFLLPVLAPKTDEEDPEETEALYRVKIDIMRTVIERLMSDSTDETDRATKIVVSQYNNRIRTCRDMVSLPEPSLNKLRIEILNHQSTCIIEAVERKELDSFAAFEFLRILLEQKNLLAHEKKTVFTMHKGWGRIRMMSTMANHNIREALGLPVADGKEKADEVRIYAERCAIDYLRKLVDNPDYPSDLVARLMIGHERMLNVIEPSQDATVTSEAVQNATVQVGEIKRRGLQFELDEIRDHYASGQLTRGQAKELRDNVSLMLIDLEEQV